MSRHLRFDMMYSFYSKDAANTGHTKALGAMHPQKALQALGITYQHATPQSMGDQWWFWNCHNVPEPLPPFLSDLGLDPMECIGFGLSEDTAKKIRDFSST
jgi:hypothetical protein